MTIRVNQLWECRDKRRPGPHRILWVSDCGEYVRLIRCGARPGSRYARASRFVRRYRLVQDVAVTVARPVELAEVA